jgi:hypothetical protein
MSSEASPGRRLHDLFAGLFEDALRLERRRRRRYMLLVALFASVAVGCLVLFDPGGGAVYNRVGSLTAPRMSLISKGLPALGQYPSVSVVGSRLVVSDDDNTSFANGRVRGTCTAASIDPASLRVMAVARGNCGDPAVFGERVMPIVYAPTTQNHPGWGTNALAIRIATIDRATPLGYRLGPVIVTYPDVSDTRAETIQGDGSLWVYAPVLNPRGRFGELLRVSLTTGRLVGHWKMPEIDRALLATDADGIWIAPSNESGWPLHASAPEKALVDSLYRVAPGMTAPARVFDVGSNGARWLVANGHSVWVSVGRPRGAPALWRFDGPNATPTIHGVATRGEVQQCGDLGEQSVTVVGSASGIFCANEQEPNAQRVQWLSSSGGRSRTVASVPTEGSYEFMDNAVLYDNAYYFVDPPGSQTTGSDRPMLYRIAPH